MQAWRGARSLRRIVPLALLAAVLGLAFRVAGSARLEPADFAFTNGVEVTSLDPAQVTGAVEGRALRFLFEGLCVKDPRTLAPLPGMAESWDVSANGLTYTFHIRDGALWTNGDRVSAHDFEWSFQRLLDPRTAAEYAYQLWYVRGAKAYTTDVDEHGAPRHSFDTVAIRAPDDRTLVMELEQPTPWFLDLCAFYVLAPVNRRNLEEMQARYPETWRSEWIKPGNIVTNGPFTLAFRRVNDRMRFVKSASYWDADHVAFHTVDCLAVEHLNTMLNLYLTGEVGWTDNAPANLIPRLLPREDFHPSPYLATYFYRVNVTRPPLDDKRVRRALALAIDREAIVSRITKAGERASWSFVPPGMPGYESVDMERGEQLAAPDERLAKDIVEARALLDEAGFGPGRRPFPPIEIHYNTQQNHKDIAEVIADSWRRNLGIQTRLLNQEWKVYLDTQSSLGYDVSRSMWIGDYPDAHGFLEIFTSGNENNRTGWTDERYDALLARARGAQGTERIALLREAERLLMDEMPILPIYSYVTKNLVDPRLGGFFENALDEHFPKFWYWKDDAELARDRALLAPGLTRVEARGPHEGLYAPASELQHERTLDRDSSHTPARSPR